MKILKIVFGVLAGLLTVAYLVQFIGELLKADSSAMGLSTLGASLAALALGAAITFALFQSALRKPPSDGRRNEKT